MASENVEFHLVLDMDGRPVASKRYRTTMKMIKYLMITACTAYLGYFLWKQLRLFLSFKTDVDVSVQFMREIRHILPGVTLCSQSL